MLNIFTNPVVLISVIAGALLIILLVAGYLKAPPDTAYIISGLGKRRILIGKAGWRVPFFERVDKISLRVMQVDVKASEAVPTNEFINVTVDGVANIKISSDAELLEKAAEALLGNSSPLYAKLYREGLINAGFAYGYEAYPGCAILFAGGDSKDPEAVRAAIAEEAARIGREGIDLKLWERLVKGSYGAKVRSLNSFENLCVSQAQSFFHGVDFLTFAEVYDALTKKEAEELIEKWIVPQRTALSIVRPKGEQA